jgi:hypothetical protein
MLKAGSRKMTRLICFFLLLTQVHGGYDVEKHFKKDLAEVTSFAFCDRFWRDTGEYSTLIKKVEISNKDDVSEIKAILEKISFKNYKTDKHPRLIGCNVYLMFFNKEHHPLFVLDFNYPMHVFLVDEAGPSKEALQFRSANIHSDPPYFTQNDDLAQKLMLLLKKHDKEYWEHLTKNPF